MIAFRPGMRSRSGPIGEGYDFVHAVQPATVTDSLIWGAARFAPSAFIEPEIVAHHAVGGEAVLERGAHQPARGSIAAASHRGDRFVDALDQEAVAAVLDHLRCRAVAPGDDRRSRRHRLDHHQPERLRPVDREQQGARAAEESRLVGIADLADELDQRVVEQRLDLVLEIGGVGVVDLGRDLQLHAGCAWRSRSPGRDASPARSGR